MSTRTLDSDIHLVRNLIAELRLDESRDDGLLLALVRQLRQREALRVRKVPAATARRSAGPSARKAV